MVVAAESEIKPFGVLSFEQTMEVVEAYRVHESYELASLHLTFPYSWPSVARLIRWSVEVGLLEAEEKSSTGGLPRKRKNAMSVWQRHPDAEASQIARLAGCSVATAFRAKASRANDFGTRGDSVVYASSSTSG